MKSETILIEPQYWGSISYFKELFSADDIVLDIHSNFQKGTYRNRCKIMGPNGLLSLSIPLVKGNEQHTVLKNLQISYSENWRKDHWQSIVTSYRRSAYFEFYEDIIQPLYEDDYEYLTDFNIASLKIVSELLRISIPFQLTETYISKGSFEGKDARDIIHPIARKMKATYDLPKYQQVFMDRMQFLPDLSILDILFNLGPRTIDYLRQ
ncbi:MAG TPA: WbqC family protein [Chitinophagales bacterium]|nr:WbqC family protein [Chitinophagales bacterium]